MFALPPSLYDKVQSLAWGGCDILRDHLGPLGLFGSQVRSVIEIGCGTGHLAAKIEAQGIEYWGIEPDLARVSEVEKRFPGRVRPYMLDQVHQWGKIFDAAIIVNVLHHLDDGMIRAGLASLSRCVPSGSVFIAEPIYTRRLSCLVNELVRFADFGRHVRTAREWRDLFRACGASGDVKPIQYGWLHGIVGHLKLPPHTAAASHKEAA